MVDILTIYTGFTHFCREISLVAITHFGRHFLAKFSGRRRKSILLDRELGDAGNRVISVGDFLALHWPMVTLPPLAPKIESSKEKNLFRTSLFAAGQKVSPLAGSRC